MTFVRLCLVRNPAPLSLRTISRWNPPAWHERVYNDRKYCVHDDLRPRETDPQLRTKSLRTKGLCVSPFRLVRMSAWHFAHCDNPHGDPEPLCAGCGVDVLLNAPSVTLADSANAMTHAGSDWHPGCWAAHLRRGEEDLTPPAREHLAAARAALARPTDRRSA